MGLFNTVVLIATGLLFCDASHFRGGIISWQPTNNANEITISYRLSWRRSYNSRTNHYCDSNTIENGILTPGEGNLMVKQTGQNILRMDYYCTDFSTHEDWTTGAYSFNFNTYGLTSFDLYFTSCCWITINNGGDSVDWSYEASVDLTRRPDNGLINSSPVTAMVPIFRAQYGCSYTINIPVSDPDLDDVRCRWPANFDESGGIYPTSGMILDQNACTLTFHANSLGYGWTGIAVVIEDFASASSTTPLSKIPLQFLVYVDSSSGPCASKPVLVDPSPDDGDVEYVWYGEEYTAVIQARGGSQNTYITEIDTVSPVGMTKTPIAQVPNSSTDYYVTVTWNPDASQQGPNIFCFSALDNLGQASDQRCITLNVCAFGPVFDVRTSHPGNGDVIHNIPEYWHAGFDRTYVLPNETALIRIYDGTNNKQIYTLDTATSPFVSDDIKPGALTFQTPDMKMARDHGQYYVLLELGVVVGTDMCSADSRAVEDTYAWRFTFTCNVTYTSPGTMTSFNYPSNYPNDMTCGTVIDAGPGEHVVLEFTSFEVESPCQYDSLSVYDGSGPESDLIGEFCGTDVPEPIESSNSSLFVVFKTDSSMSYSGFEAQYNFVGESTTPQSTTLEDVTEVTTIDSTTDESEPAANMVCTDNTMTVYVPRSVVGNVRAENLHLLDSSCVGTDHNATHILLETPFDSCETLMQVDEDHIIFSNVVIDDALPITPGNVITRDRDMEIPVECHMDKEGFGSLSFDPDTSKIIYSEEGYGSFSFQMMLYQDQQYRTPYPPSAFPVDVDLRDILYMEAQVSAEPGLELFVESCMATPTSDPEATPQYQILEDGCAKDHTFQYFASSDPMVQRFGLEAFAFVGTHTPVFIHCYLRLCNITDPSSRCALRCQPSINKRDVSMREERASGSKPYVMSRGPLNVIEEIDLQMDEEQGQKNTVNPPRPNNFLVGTVGVLTLCLMSMIGVFIAKTRKTPYPGYALLSQDE